MPLVALLAVLVLVGPAQAATPPPLPAHVRTMLTGGGYHMTPATIAKGVAVYKAVRGRHDARVAERFATSGQAGFAADVLRKLHGRGGDPGTRIDRIRVWQRFVILDVHVN